MRHKAFNSALEHLQDVAELHHISEIVLRWECDEIELSEFAKFGAHMGNQIGQTSGLDTARTLWPKSAGLNQPALHTWMLVHQHALPQAAQIS